jgi:DTW domain-containing protein YfiP
LNKRPVCPHCDFLKVRCLCEHLCSINNQTKLIILQHPSEKKHPLNTVKLMKLCFKNIQIFVGENFSQHKELNLIIEKNSKYIALVYPDQNINTNKEKADIRILILLDGTWKKTFKIYSLSTNLHTLPKISFLENVSSNYRIRSSSKSNTLSTLEAANLALKLIEPSLKTSELNNLFDKMINFQIEKMGPEIFQKNYDKKKGSD